MDKRHDCVYDPDNECMVMVRCGKRRGRWNGVRDWTAAILVAASTIVGVVVAGLLGQLLRVGPGDLAGYPLFVLSLLGTIVASMFAAAQIREQGGVRHARSLASVIRD